MADEIVSGAPGGGAPSGGGAAPAAPSSPAPTTTPAPASTPAASETPSVPVVPAAITRNPGETGDDFLKRYREQQKTEVKTGDEKPVDPAAVPAEPAKPVAEVPKPEPAKVEEKPVEVKPDESAAPAQSRLAETIFSNEKLSAALEEAGLKDELAEELRTAAVGRQFGELFTDMETARFARAQAESYAVMDDAASNLVRGDVKSTRDFVQKVLMPMSYVLKEDGNPEMIEIDNGQGQKIQVARVDGKVDDFLSNVGDLRDDRAIFDANGIMARVKANPDDPGSETLKQEAEELMFAADVYRRHFGDKKPEPENMSPEMKAERAKLDADKQALVAERNRTASESFDRAVDDNVVQSDKMTDDSINTFLDQSSLAPNPADSQQTRDSKEFLRTSIRKEIRDGLHAKMAGNGLYKSEQAQAARKGIAGLKSLPAITKRYVEKFIYEVAEPILTKAGHERIRQSQARSSKIAAQQEASKNEARAGAAPAKPQTQKLDERQIMRDVTADLTKKLNRLPNMDEQVAEWRIRVAAAKAKSVAV